MGLTLKQFARRRFFELCRQYQEAKQHLDTKEDKAMFVALSIALHVAKGDVPKHLWRYAK